MGLARLDPAPLRYVTWGSKSLQSFDHLEDRNLALYEEILKEARSRFEPGERLSWTFGSPVGDEPATC